MSSANQKWDTRYEWKAVTLLAIGFGLVGLDRCVILPLFPVIMKDLALTYQDIGNISGALAMAWGVAAMFMGRVSDRIGRRKVLIPAVLGFSLMAGLSGLATGALSLLLIRALMGISEGAYTPASIAATLEASKPSRRGFNLGLQQNTFPLFGLALGPIVATQLLPVLPSWRWIFVLVAIPGFVVAFLMHRVLRDTHAAESASSTCSDNVDAPKWTDVLRYRNVPLNMMVMFCILTCLFVISAMISNYLTDYLHLGVEQMGFVISAIGFGGCVGQLILPGLSDRFGRKPMMLASFAGAGMALMALMHTGADPLMLFALLFLISAFVFNMACLTVGPLTTESVPAGLTSTASGLVIGVGEVFGGGVAPVLAGFVAQNYGIENIMYLALGGLAVGSVIALGLKETAPLHLKTVSGRA